MMKGTRRVVDDIALGMLIGGGTAVVLLGLEALVGKFFGQKFSEWTVPAFFIFFCGVCGNVLCMRDAQKLFLKVLSLISIVGFFLWMAGNLLLLRIFFLLKSIKDPVSLLVKTIKDPGNILKSIEALANIKDPLNIFEMLIYSMFLMGLGIGMGLSLLLLVLLLDRKKINRPYTTTGEKHHE